MVGNIDEDLVSDTITCSARHTHCTQYPVFEAAITGRAALEGSWKDPNEDPSNGGNFSRGGSIIDLSAQSEEEMEAIRNAVVQKECLLLSVFDVLRRVPRRVLMVLKLNDLTRCVSSLPCAGRMLTVDPQESRSCPRYHTRERKRLITAA